MDHPTIPVPLDRFRYTHLPRFHVDCLVGVSEIVHNALPAAEDGTPNAYADGIQFFLGLLADQMEQEARHRAVGGQRSEAEMYSTPDAFTPFLPHDDYTTPTASA